MQYYMGVNPKIVVPQNRWFIMENPINMDDLGVPLFLETPIYILFILCLKKNFANVVLHLHVCATTTNQVACHPFHLPQLQLQTIHNGERYKVNKQNRCPFAHWNLLYCRSCFNTHQTSVTSKFRVHIQTVGNIPNILEYIKNPNPFI